MNVKNPLGSLLGGGAVTTVLGRGRISGDLVGFASFALRDLTLTAVNHVCHAQYRFSFLYPSLDPDARIRPRGIKAGRFARSMNPWQTFILGNLSPLLKFESTLMCVALRVLNIDSITLGGSSCIIAGLDVCKIAGDIVLNLLKKNANTIIETKANEKIASFFGPGMPAPWFTLFGSITQGSRGCCQKSTCRSRTRASLSRAPSSAAPPRTRSRLLLAQLLSR